MKVQGPQRNYFLRTEQRGRTLTGGGGPSNPDKVDLSGGPLVLSRKAPRPPSPRRPEPVRSNFKDALPVAFGGLFLGYIALSLLFPPTGAQTTLLDQAISLPMQLAREVSSSTGSLALGAATCAATLGIPIWLVMKGLRTVGKRLDEA